MLDCLTKSTTVKQEEVAKGLLHWAQKGFSELGDKIGQGIGTSMLSVISHENFLKNPEEVLFFLYVNKMKKVAKTYWENTGKKVASNGAVMRTAIVGVPFFYNLEKVVQNTKKACQVCV